MVDAQSGSGYVPAHVSLSEMLKRVVMFTARNRGIAPEAIFARKIQTEYWLWEMRAISSYTRVNSEGAQLTMLAGVPLVEADCDPLFGVSRVEP